MRFPRAVLLGWLTAGVCAGASAAARRLNVLFIAVDDLRPELRCYGDAAMHTPNIDRLAAQGVLFARAYCQQALCAPSRASVLTGLRPDATGIFDLSHPVRQSLPHVQTLPQTFREHGYLTLSLGKIYHHPNDDNGVGWSEPAWMPPGPWLPAADPANAAGPPNGRTTAWECADVPDNFYADGKVADRAVETLARVATAKQPFFLAVGFFKPHLPFFAPKRYWDLYRRGDIRLPFQRQWPRDMPELAGTDSGELRQYRGIPQTGTLPDDLARTLIHGYRAAVSYTDAQIGRVLAALEAQGLRERTLIVLWGDHGWKLDDYGAWCKHTNFEIDARVPLIISPPRAATAGQSCQALVELVDLYPTLAELCGLPIPAHCQGHSLAALLANPTGAVAPVAFTQYPRGLDIMGYSVRDERWRYTEWRERRSGDVVARELYDHAEGPVTARNLADDPHYAGEVARLAPLLAGKSPRASVPVAQPHSNTRGATSH